MEGIGVVLAPEGVPYCVSVVTIPSERVVVWVPVGKGERGAVVPESPAPLLVDPRLDWGSFNNGIWLLSVFPSEAADESAADRGATLVAPPVISVEVGTIESAGGMEFPGGDGSAGGDASVAYFGW